MTGARAEQPVILVLGDSLSAAYGIQQNRGWVALLQERLQQAGFPHQVVNASISGDTTAGGLSRLPAALQEFQPEILIIELGGNDGLRGLSIDQTQAHLERMITLARDAQVRPLLLGMMLPPNYGKAFTERFQRLYREIAEKRDVPLVPFFLAGVADNPAWMQPDGIHPRAVAQPRMLEHVWQQLGPMLETEQQASMGDLDSKLLSR